MGVSATDFLSLPPTCTRCAIRSESLCSELSPIELSALSGISRRRVYEPGQVIVTEGDNDVFCNVVTGLLVEKKALSDGREQILSLLLPADFHGGPNSAVADASVHAVTRSTVCQFERAAFDDLLSGFPGLKQAVLEHSLTALTNAREWMLLLGQKTAEERVATFLLHTAERQGESGCSHIRTKRLADGVLVQIPITRSQIAAYLGLTIETVSRRLTALRDANLIEFDNSRLVRLLDVDQLRIAAGELSPKQ